MDRVFVRNRPKCGPEEQRFRDQDPSELRRQQLRKRYRHRLPSAVRRQRGSLRVRCREGDGLPAAAASGSVFGEGQAGGELGELVAYVDLAGHIPPVPAETPRGAADAARRHNQGGHSALVVVQVGLSGNDIGSGELTHTFACHAP